MDTMSKVSDNEIKITRTTEEVIPISQLREHEAMLQEQVSQIQKILDKVKEQIDEAIALGIKE